MGGQARQSFESLLQPYSEEFFQKSVVDPTLTQYRQQILPEIAQQFIGADASSSSALNQALAKSASELANSLAGQRLGLQQLTSQNQMGALGGLGGLLGQRAFSPIIQEPKEGLLGSIISAVGAMLGGYLGGPPGAAAGAQLDKAVPKKPNIGIGTDMTDIFNKGNDYGLPRFNYENLR